MPCTGTEEGECNRILVRTSGEADDACCVLSQSTYTVVFLPMVYTRVVGLAVLVILG